MGWSSKVQVPIECKPPWVTEECDYSEDAVVASVVLSLARVACDEAAKLVGSEVLWKKPSGIGLR